MDEVGQKVCVIGLIKYSECIELEVPVDDVGVVCACG